MSDIGFEFPLDTSQQWDGFNDSGIETFSGAPFRSLGREGSQNTLDATKQPPARIMIRRIDVATTSIPGVDELKDAIELCKLAAGEEGPKAKQFFRNASALLSAPNISILQFSDSNTKGVVGPCENGFPYFALMKAIGQSKKDSPTAAGSFGIGKFAPYTVSGLRTIFLTTVWQDESGDLKHYVQGKAILMSHVDDSGQTFRGTGFWGVRKNCQPLIGQQDQLPEWLRRHATDPDDTGTTLSILGFEPTEGWQKLLAASIAESFFGAIHRGHLVVEIEDGPTIDASNLSQMFGSKEIVYAISGEKDQPGTFESSGQFLQALSSNEKIVEETESAKLGHCQLHILVGEDLPKKVAILRHGMLITSELDRLKRFNEFKEFVAVFECLSERGNELLRAMEPPAHDDFEPDRLITSKQAREGRVALRELATWIRSMLRRHAQDPVAEVTEIDELAEFFGDEDGNNGKDPRAGDINPRGALKIRARSLPRRKPTVTIEGEGTGGGGGGGSSEGRGRGGTGPGPGPGPDTGGEATAKTTLRLKNVRAVVITSNRRQLAFTPEVGGNIRIQLEDSGADTNRPLQVASATAGTIINGGLNLNCEAGKRVMIAVDLDRPFDGTIRVSAHAI